MTDTPPRPLAGLRVLELARILAGPWAGQLLADLGADVIKIERPGAGDDTRHWGPPFMTGPDGENLSAAYYHACNRGKRSVALDIATTEGQARVSALAAQADVVIENYKVGGLAKYGLDAASLRALNPRLIVCSITGFGQTGPYKDRAGHDMNYLAIAGVLGYNGRKASGPAPVSVQIADVAGGSCHAVMGILAAVIHRQQSGEGQFVDISMTDAAFTLHALTAPPALVAGIQPEMEGTQLNGGSFYDCYETADGRWFSVGGLEPQFFMAFCAALGRPELAPMGMVMGDPAVVAQLKAEIRAEMRKKTFAEWSEVFAGIDSCTEPVLSFAEACAHPHVQARNLIVEVPRPDGTLQKQLGSAIKFSATPPSFRFIGAEIGAHTDEVLRGLGYADGQIAALRQAGVVA
jgi:crotonobetainyl-CoA:carnitine CoA-transferase CaiB-like acyl-CoA transferase